MLNLEKRIVLNRDVIEAPNLCDRFSSADLTAIGLLCQQGYAADKHSRAKWEKRNEAAMDLAMQLQKDKQFPWPGCANVIFPLITIAAIQFSSRSYSNIIQGTSIVKYRVSGEDPIGALTQRAKRVGRHMSWQVLEEDKAWEEQHDKLMTNLGIVGINFVKSYFSSSKGYTVSELVMARDLVVNYWAKSIDDCPRKSHIVPLQRNEIYERVMDETFRDILDKAWFQSPALSSTSQPKHDNRIGQDPPSPPDDDTPFTTIEQHRNLDLDKDGYAEPYIVTYEQTSGEVVRLVSRISRPEDITRRGDSPDGQIQRIKPEEFFTKYGFIPAPDGSIYDVGFGILLGPLNEGVNTTINQLLDSGTMANSNGGFLGRGAKIRGGQYTFAPWEWKRVDSTGDDLRKSMVQIPTRDPSTVMFQLLSLLINYTDRLAGTVDAMVGESPGQNAKTGVVMNTMEQGMTVYSSIFKRVWRSMKEEFAKRYILNATYLDASVPFGDKGEFILREDYKNDPNMIAPVADPRIMSDGQRIQQAQLLAQRATQVPGYNAVAVEQNLLAALQIDGVEVFYPGPDKIPAPKDPKVAVKEMDLQQQKWEFTQSLAEERRVNSATITKLQAEAAKLSADASLEASAQKISAFQTAISALSDHNNMINERIRLLHEVNQDDSETGNGGGVPSVAGASGDRAGA